MHRPHPPPSPPAPEPPPGTRASRGSPPPPFVLDPEAVFYLLIQRSRYRFQPLYRLLSLLGAGGLYKRHLAGSFVERRRVHTIGRLYREDVEATLDRVTPHLPGTVQTVVDIGCGLGGMSLGTWLRWPESVRHLFLVDRTAITPGLHCGYRPRAAFYNSLDEARRFLEANGVPPGVIHPVDVERDAYPENRADLVISTFAWGFHFPVDTYLDRVVRTLHPEGTVVLHVRNGTGGMETMQAHFDSVRELERGRTSRLVAARGPRPTAA